jgi:UDP-GlcNAc:undecaprenyl-phosphate/decaprenyl-phosphate GlcNAc-1-phosphate transferase
MTDLADVARLMLGPLFVTLLLTDVLIRAAPTLRLVDVPDERKNHVRPTPKIGGLAIFAALLALVGIHATLNGLPPDTSLYLLLGGGLILVVLGLMDDLFNLPWQLRIAVQTAVAVVTLLLWPGPLGWPVRAVGVVWVVGMTNAFNMLDNMDALSPGTALIASACLAAVLLLRPAAWVAWHPALLFVMLAWSLAGFLWFNRSPARAFLGDAGSTFLGFALGVGSLNALAVADGDFPWLAPVALLAVPCYDMTSVVLIRLRQRRSPFHADRQHLSHRLVRLGLRPVNAVTVIHLTALASGLAGLVLYLTHELATAVLVAAALAGWWVAVAVLEVGVWGKRSAP